MKFNKPNIMVAVLLVSTAIYTVFVFIPSTSKELINTEVSAIVDTPKSEEVEERDLISNSLNMVLDNPQTYEFKVINRELPTNWNIKGMYFKYTFLGEYEENTLNSLNELLLGEYKWQRQLDSKGDIVLGGPIFIKDGVYQLHTHNGLSLGKRHFLFGDLLGYLFSNNELDGTQIQIGELVLENIWNKDTHILQDPTTPAGAELVISTCLERDGDRRLISGWIVQK
jgi:hypothetical protein